MRYKGNKDIYVLEDQPMKAGGEGAIYAIQNHPDKVAKIYHADRLSSELEDKIIFMANNPPAQNVLDQIAWPLDVVRNAMGDFVGFVMPKLQIDTDLKAIYAYPPNPKIPITCEQKVIVALNICIVISAIHKAGYVFGDFNPLNIGINLKTGHVAFLDTDSYHITDPHTGKLYRCGVCLDGYAAPELIQQCKGTDFLNAPLPAFTQETDRFALAIHIFKLLMNGYTPFNGIKEGESASQASPGVGNLAIERDNYCFKPGNKPQSAATPDIKSLSPDLQYLLKKTFLGGATKPDQRATADEWYNALKEYKDNLVQCKDNPAHHHYKKIKKCPYCAADDNYAQSMSAPTVGLHTMFGGTPNQFNFGTPVNVPPSGRTQTSNYANQTQVSQKKLKKNKSQATKQSGRKTVGRVLCWIFFFPVMLTITACKSKLPLLVKILIVPTLLQLCLYYFGLVIAGSTFALDYFNIVEVEQIEAKLDDFFNEVFDKDIPSYSGVNSTSSDNTTTDNGIYIDGNFKYTKNETGYTVEVVLNNKDKLVGDVVIPSTYKGLPVNEIVPSGFKNCNKMTSVTIPDSVTVIHEGAFNGCTSLQSITLPFVGKSIDAEAYESVFGFIFGYEAVEKKTEYTTANMAYNDEPISIVGETWQITWQDDEWTRIYYYYEIPESLTRVTITKQNVVSAYAFNGCSNITEIDYLNTEGKKLTIGEGAFQGCSNLQFGGENLDTLTIADNIIEIGAYAYNGCSNLVKVVVPQTVRKIGVAAFMGCNNIKSMELPFVGGAEDATNYQSVLGFIFGYEIVEKEMSSSPSKDTIYNDKPISIVGETWQYTYQKEYDRTRCYYYYYIPSTLESITITKQIAIPAYAFNGCSTIKTVVLPKGAVKGEYAFQDCKATVTEADT